MSFKNISENLDKVLEDIETYYDDYGFNSDEQRTVENVLDDVIEAVSKKYNVEINGKLYLKFKNQ